MLTWFYYVIKGVFCLDYQIADLIHRQIILDLTIRTLERDRKYLDTLKMKRPLDLWIDYQVSSLHNDLISVKAELFKSGAKLQAEEKVDETITEYIILVKGQTYERRYMNIALRNWVEEEVKRLLGLPFKTTDSGK